MPEGLSLDSVATVVAGVLTVMVLSYLAGDNPFYRLAVHIFIGVAAGYAGAVAWHSVIRPALVQPLLDHGVKQLADPQLLVSWLLSLLLLTKIIPALGKLGSLPMAVLVGAGAAVVVGGAIMGTLIPQSVAAMDSLNPAAVIEQTGETGRERIASVLIMLLGTVSVLLYFRTTLNRAQNVPVTQSPAGKVVRTAGELFIAVTFGAMYAGALMAAIVVLVERIQFLLGLVF